MPSLFLPDWKALAEAHRVELPEAALERLRDISRTLLGLRGMLDWGEEPAAIFRVDASEPEPHP
ncbi:MAG: hypothetical protein N2036_08195 [Bryobacteraceae bacterium]|nr:hypothetical protein [Bryobacteraceae bacterium]MCX7604043.1 hypothetical protein [Bryobacteraceae bacterium]